MINVLAGTVFQSNHDAMNDDGRILERLGSDGPEAAEALHELFFAHAQSLIGFARRFVTDRETAEDVVQTVFLALWRNRQTTRIDGDIKSYLFTATRNQALNVLRHAQTVLEFERDVQLSIPTPQGHFDRVEYEQLRDAIQRAVNGLPEQSRRVFLMSRLDGLTYRQIASTLGISIKTVETLMGRALKHIRSAIVTALVIFAAGQIIRFFL